MKIQDFIFDLILLVAFLAFLDKCLASDFDEPKVFRGREGYGYYVPEVDDFAEEEILEALQEAVCLRTMYNLLYSHGFEAGRKYFLSNGDTIYYPGSECDGLITLFLARENGTIRTNPGQHNSDSASLDSP